MKLIKIKCILENMYITGNIIYKNDTMHNKMKYSLDRNIYNIKKNSANPGI